MKKSTLVNCVIIIGLLVLCVMTLLAVYATAPESSVLLLDETFSNLDENKWRHEISSCTEDGTQFDYYKNDNENGFAADGTLHIFPIPSEPRNKREAVPECLSCTCNSSLFSASLETRDVFYATAGRVVVRAKFQRGNGVKLRIGVFSNNSNPKIAQILEENKKTPTDSSDQVIVTFMSPVNQTSLKRAVPDNDFHIYEIEWNSEKINLNVDNRTTQSQAKSLNGSAQVQTVPLTQPFYLNVKVDFSEKPAKQPENHTESAFPNDTNHTVYSHSEETVLEIDYIKLFRIKN